MNKAYMTEMINKLQQALKDDPDIAVNIADGMSQYYLQLARRNYKHIGKENNGIYNTPAVDIDILFELIKTLIEKGEAIDGVVESERITFSLEMPVSKAITPSVIGRVIKRAPGGLSADKVGSFGSIKEVVPHIREEFLSKNDIGNVNLRIGQYYDNIIELRCYSKTNKEANRMALWLETLMSNYRWFFQASGIKEVLFYERLEDKTEMLDDGPVFYRPLRFWVKTEKVTIRTRKALTQMILNVYIKV